MIAAICIVAIGYRYYSAFIAAKVLALDDARETPAHRFNDGFVDVVCYDAFDILHVEGQDQLFQC